MGRGRFVLIIVAVALVAIIAVVVSSGGGDSGSEGSAPAAERSDGGGEEPAVEEEQREQETPREEAPREEEPAEPEPVELPDNPDEVRGSDPYALTRTRNLRRALAVLDRERRRVEGAFESLRVAPGRIDTVIVHPDDRRTNIQVRADFEISFQSTHDFPTAADFRKGGLTGRDIDPAAPARLLRQIDRIRRGSAEHDVDYLVMGRDIIDFDVDVSAYMRIRTPRPRAFLKEPDTPLRAIG